MTENKEPLAVRLNGACGVYHGDDTFYWFTVHVGLTKTEKNEKGEDERFLDEDLWRGIRGLNPGFSCLSVYSSEERAWEAMLGFLAKWRKIAMDEMGYSPVGDIVEFQDEFREWHAHCDFDLDGRQVRLEGWLHAVNRF